MTKIYQELLNELKEYKNPKTNIARLVKNGQLFYATCGLYETNKDVDPSLLAVVTMPYSYLSFQKALEHSWNITSIEWLMLKL